MADATVTPVAPKKQRRFLRVLALLLAIFVVCVVALYFIATSSAFLTGFVLPRAGKILNAQITVSGASIHPFGEVVFQNLKVKTTGDEPLLAVSEVHARYSLMQIIRGNILVDEVSISSPTIALIENADGTSNLDPLLNSQKGQPKPKAPEPSSKPSKPPQISLKKFAITEATVRRVKVYRGGARDVAEISHVNVALSDLRNGQTAKLVLSAGIKVENNPPAPGTNGLLEAQLKGEFSLSLTPELKPSSISGGLHSEITRAADAMSDLASLGCDLNCEVSPTEIKDVALRFVRGGARLGEVRVSGPLDMAKMEGRLKVEILSIDKQVLNLAGASSGLDFGTTTLSFTNDIELAKSGSLINVSGRLDLNKLQLTRAKQTTPSLDLFAQYRVSVDRTASNAVVRELTIAGTQKGKALLSAGLSGPMSFAWGEGGNAAGDATMTFAIEGFNLPDWKTFLGDSVSQGMLNLKLNLASQQGGKQLVLSLKSQIDDLSAGSGSNQITQASITLTANGGTKDMKRFTLADYGLQIAHRKQTVLSVSGTGSYDVAAQEAEVQADLKSSLPRLLEMAPSPGLELTSGTVEFKAHVSQKPRPGKGTNSAPAVSVTGNFALSDFTGKLGQSAIQNLAAAIDFEVVKAPDEIQIRSGTGKLSENGKPGGGFGLSGAYDLERKSAQFTVTLADFNESALRPFLEPALGGKQLVSIGINGSATAKYEPNGPAGLKADLGFANLVVHDPAGQIPDSPLEAKVKVDLSFDKQVADLRQCSLMLTPTKRAQNEMLLSGRLDLSQTNAIQGNLKLTAEALDFTSYYDLFDSGKKKQKTAATQSGQPQATATTGPAPPDPNQELDPIILPVRDFKFDANIRKLYVREVEISDFELATKLDHSHVQVNPLKLLINGAPASLTLDSDLGIPGYKYDVLLSAEKLPLTPLVNSFAPERKGQIRGTMTAHAKINGAGTTGANLKKNLAGQFDLATADMNLSVLSVSNRTLKAVINVVAAIPQMVRNPAAMFKKNGLLDELTAAPINVIKADGEIQSGEVNLKLGAAESSAFKAEAAGTVMIVEVLTNSTLHIPVEVFLSRDIAGRLNLLSEDTPTNAVYGKLPSFLTMLGTVGDPKPDIRKTVLAGAVVKSVGGLVTDAGGKTGSLLKQAGGFLTGTSDTTNTQSDAGTNAPPAKKTTLRGLLNKALKTKNKTE